MDIPDYVQQTFGVGQYAQPQVDPNRQRIEYLYNLAQMNPYNQDYANMYLGEYMNYMFPQNAGMGAMGGQMGGFGGQMANPYQPSPYAQNAQQNTQPTQGGLSPEEFNKLYEEGIDIPDDSGDQIFNNADQQFSDLGDAYMDFKTRF